MVCPNRSCCGAVLWCRTLCMFDYVEALCDVVALPICFRSIDSPLCQDSSSDSHDTAAGDTTSGPNFTSPADCWPWSVVLKVAEGVACGMNYLHGHQPSPILHRDLKSANLLLDDSFNVKICDFGLARSCPSLSLKSPPGHNAPLGWNAD